MESKAKALGHPIHQMLIPFPFGLLATAVIFDVIHLVRGASRLPALALGPPGRRGRGRRAPDVGVGE